MTTFSLDAARSGMLSQQRNLELIANNLANVNTTGYKSAKMHFQDVLDASEILDVLNGSAPADGELGVGRQPRRDECLQLPGIANKVLLQGNGRSGYRSVGLGRFGYWGTFGNMNT